MMCRTIAKRLATAVLLAGVGLTAGGCEDIRKVFGFDKSPPDEFRTVSRAPLSIPPEFSLRPPQPGAARPQEPEQMDRARQALTGRPRGTAVQSRGAGALLDRAGASQAQPGVREAVNREAGEAAADDTLLDRLLSRSPGSSIVDPSGESQRIREAQSQGRPPIDGETPVIRPRRRGVLDWIF
jgi:Protein of unknown function (DUF3035)